MSRLTKPLLALAACLASLLLAAPAGAVETTSGGATTAWGSFYCSYLSTQQWKTSWLGDTRDRLTYTCTWRDRMNDGHPVYIQVQGVRTGPMPDTGWNRLTGDAWTHRRESSWFEAKTINYFELRVCLDVAGDDPCSGKVHVDS